MRVLGIDTSLTCTGVAVITGTAAGVTVTTHTVETAPPKRAKGDKTPATVRERYERLQAIRDLGLPVVRGRFADLAVVEAPSYGSVGGSTWDRAGAWWFVVGRLLAGALSTPVAIVPPRTRALWATGSGASSKAPVAVHLSRMWPDVDPGISDDEWDALALASMGAQYLGLLPVELARHREQLGKVIWPVVLEGVPA